MTKAERLNAIRQAIEADEKRAEQLHRALSENLHDTDPQLFTIVFEQYSTLEEFIRRCKKRLAYEEQKANV